MIAEERIALRQQRDLSELIQDAITVYSQRFWLFFAIAAVVIPVGILTGILTAELAPTFEGVYEDEEAFDELFRDLGVLLAVVAPLSLLQFFVQWLASLAIIVTLVGLDAEPDPELSHARRQQRSPFTRAYGVVFARFWTLLGATLRVIFPILLLSITIIGIPWAIYLAVRWLFVNQAVILDSTSARAALSYSAHAVSGRWWRTLGIAFLISLIVSVPGGIVGTVFGLAPVYISSTASSVVGAALLPLGVIAMTLMYFDLKQRKESDVALSPA